VYYFLDGYNLLFSCLENEKTLRTQRQNLIRWIQRSFASLNLSGTLVFDGAHRREEESGFSYPSPLEVVYTPKGQSADSFIVEQLGSLKSCKCVTVITNDTGLRRHAQSAGAKTQSNEAFLQWLLKKERKNTKKPKALKETDFQIQRLTEIFEERMKKGSNDDLKGWE
jgi:predicted RNA-binding protein with PIN domain